MTYFILETHNVTNLGLLRTRTNIDGICSVKKYNKSVYLADQFPREFSSPLIGTNNGGKVRGINKMRYIIKQALQEVQQTEVWSNHYVLIVVHVSPLQENVCVDGCGVGG